MRGLMKYATPHIEIQGEDVLADVVAQIKNGVPTIFYPNHVSNADGAIVDKVLEDNGILPVFLAGQKLRRNPVTNLLSRAVTTILVWPPSLEAKGKRAEAKKRRINQQTSIAAKEALSHGFPLVIFPEATRSKTGALLAGNPKIAERYHELVAHTVVVPVGIDRSDHILPHGSIVPRRARPVIFFGKPLDATELRRLGERKDPGNWSQGAMDEVMKQIAQMLPPGRRGVYA